jgi:hypothetical protein
LVFRKESVDQCKSWTYLPAYLSYSRWVANEPNGCGYGCGGAQFPNDQFRYLGLKISNGAEEIFAWVHLKILTTAQGQSITITSYASNVFKDIEIPEESKNLLRVVDLLGRTTNPEYNQVLLYIYDDGSVEKKMVLQE